jgi:glycosyltransferase involved in cell wall biosynthesis
MIHEPSKDGSQTAAAARPRVVMLVANEFVHDTRVYKEARSLQEWGCDVHVIATARPDLSMEDHVCGIRVHRLGVVGRRAWRLAPVISCWWCRPLLQMLVPPLHADRPELVPETAIANKPEGTMASQASAHAKRQCMSPSLNSLTASSTANPLPPSSHPLREWLKAQSEKNAIFGHARRAYVFARMAVYRMKRLPGRIARILRRISIAAPKKAMRRFIPGVGGLLGLNYDMARRALALRPEVIQAHDLNTLPAAILVKRLTGIPLVYDSHELFLERNTGRPSAGGGGGRGRSARQWRDTLTWAPIERFCIRRCDAVISVAEGICQHLARRYRIPKPHLIRNVQPYEPPPPSSQRSRLLSDELGIPHDVAVVLYPGLITINRGLEALIDSAPYLHNAAYVIMGYARNPKYLESLKNRAAALGVLGATLFFRSAVPIDQVVRYTASADLGIVPTQNVCLSYYFEASNKIFHCLMAGVPLAMSDHAEKRLIVEQYGVGVLFDETDPRNIADAVNAVLADREQYLKMRRNCLAAARVVNWEHEEHKLRTIFARLLGSSAPAVPAIQVPLQPEWQGYPTVHVELHARDKALSR